MCTLKCVTACVIVVYMSRSTVPSVSCSVNKMVFQVLCFSKVLCQLCDSGQQAPHSEYTVSECYRSSAAGGSTQGAVLALDCCLAASRNVCRPIRRVLGKNRTSSSFYRKRYTAGVAAPGLSCAACCESPASVFAGDGAVVLHVDCLLISCSGIISYPMSNM